MNIEATAKQIMSARHSDNFTQEACEKILRDNLSGEEPCPICDATLKSGWHIKNIGGIRVPVKDNDLPAWSGAAQPKPESWQKMALDAANGIAREVIHKTNANLFQGDTIEEIATKYVLSAIERSHAAQPQSFMQGFKEGWMRACVFYVDNDAEMPDHDCSKQLEIRLKGIATQPQPSKASPVGERSELGNHDCEYDSDGAPCNHCGKTASEAIIYFERNIRKQRSDQPPSLAKATDGKQVNVNEIVMDLRVACGDPANLHRKFFDILWPIFDAHNAERAAECQRREQAEEQFLADRGMFKATKETLLEQLTKYGEQLLSALAAIEKKDKALLVAQQAATLMDEKWTDIEEALSIHVDLSALHEHDEKLTAEVRKSLVDALKCVQLMFKRSDTSDNFLGDDEQEAWTAVNDALAKAKP